MRLNEGEEDKKVDISDLMETFGKYHIIQYTLMCIPAVFMAMVSINYVFTVREVDYRCRIDECEDANSTAQFPSWWPDINKDKCLMPVLRSGEDICSNNSFTEEMVSCSSWIYENDDSAITELNLACQPWKSNVIGSVHNTGMMISTALFGWLSDKIGRKPVFILCAMGALVGIIKNFVTSYIMYIIVEVILAILSGGFYSVAFVIFLEITGKKYRVLSGVLFAYAIYLGEIIFSCFAMLVPNWKSLNYIISTPSLFCIALIFVINESPRWQIINGKIEEAKKIMLHISNVNKINIDSEELTNINETQLKEKFKIGKNDAKESFIDSLKSTAILKRLLVSIAMRFTANFVYYGMLINSVVLPGNKNVNFILTALMSFPGDILCLYLLNKYGRKGPLLVAFVLCGVLCIISAFTPSRFLWVKLLLFLFGKIIIAGCYTGSISYNMELFPTSVRGTLVGIGFLASRVGGIIAPLTPILNTVSVVLPFTIFGLTSIISGLLIILTPETKDLPLFDTIKQVENHDEDLKTEAKKKSKSKNVSDISDAALHI